MWATAPVVTDATRDLMQRRRQALAQLGHRSASYSELNRAVRSALRRDTRDDIQRRIAEGGASSVWRSIRNVVGDRRSGRVTPDATPDALNAYFVGVGPRVAAEVADLGAPPDLPHH